MGTLEHLTPLRYIRGIGPRRAEALEKLGVKNLRDLFYLFPRRYEDRSKILKITEITPAENATIQGEVLTLGIRPLKQMRIFEMIVGDETGMIPVLWFNQPFLKNQFRVGMKVILSGRVDLYQDKLQMNSPEYEIIEEDEENLLHTGRIVPIYPLTEGLFQRSLRAVLNVLINENLEKEIHEFLPGSFIKSLELTPLLDTLKEIHHPGSFEKLEAARRRLIFDEFFLFELELLERLRYQREKQDAFVIQDGEKCFEDFKKSIPFTLTISQDRAIHEIIQDCTKPYPMSRLLHGEVGSGKTLVAAFALFLIARSDKQAAFLVPTELLAEQHLKTIEQLLKPLGVAPELLTASTPTDKREKLLTQVRNGKLPILIGTHALLQSDVLFQSLALVIIDEQHKFGVRQRTQLLQTIPKPHLLVMTATPIPRTLALTLYGDLEVSTMSELPKGRSPVKTYWIVREKQPDVLQHIRDRVLKGDQAYIVFPSIDETEKSDLFAARQEFERLVREDFKGLSLGLVHGRLTREEREQIMQDFRRGGIQVLIATSVVEVGVDNPNAAIIVIENAERFGLSQLHQLRGRVGRGVKESECFLFGEPKNDEGKRRLRILTKSNDGFRIAEEDLRMRGPGELLGTRQSGEPYFRIADLQRDADLLFLARQKALEVLKEDPRLSSPQWEKLRAEMTHRGMK